MLLGEASILANLLGSLVWNSTKQTGLVAGRVEIFDFDSVQIERFDPRKLATGAKPNDDRTY